MVLLSTRLGQWVVGVTLLVTLLATLTAVGATQPLEEAVAAVFGPVQRVLRRGAEPFANFITNVDNYDTVDDENRALRSRVEQLEADLTRLREEQIAIRGREALLEVQQQRADAILVTANVITRDLSGLRDIIVIDQGTTDGVQAGQPVLAAGGSLVGVVIEARAHRAFVRLITDPDTSIRVLHQLSRTEGILQGDTAGDLRVHFIPQTTDVQPGHTFVTSGQGGLLPKGIPVGTVAAAEGTAQDVFTRIRLRPLAPLDQLEAVLVEVTFTPTPLLVPDQFPRPAAADSSEEDGSATGPTDATPGGTGGPR